MNIANPIYDQVFKQLMSNARIAKFFIGTIISETIVDVTYKPQEIVYNKGGEPVDISIFRLDFVATVKTADGNFKKILIEIQKTRKFINIMRFRNYLAEQYKQVDQLQPKNKKKKEKEPLPITTIYLLGFKFPHIMATTMKVARNYIDLDTGEEIKEKEDFIEKLTHDCYVVQIPRIEGKLQNRLQQLLSFFEQKYFVDDTGMIKEYNYPIDTGDEEMKYLANRLHFACSDPESRRLIEAEQEALRMIDVGVQEGLMKKDKEIKKLRKEKEEQDKALEEKDKTLQEKDNALQEKDKTLLEKDKTMQEKDKTLQEKDKTLQEKDKAIKEKDKTLEDRENEIIELKHRLGII